MPTSRKDLPEIAKPIADRIESLGFKWEYDPEYRLPQPDDIQRVQIRDASHYAPRGEVTTYKQAMKRGDKFPPGVVTRDGRYVDFNTRAAAAQSLGWLYFPVFVINVDYDEASKEDQDLVHLLGAAFNTRAGRRLDRNELTAQIRRVADDSNWSAERIALLLGVSNNTVTGIFAQVRAEHRAESLGVPFNGSVTASNITMLGQRSPKLTDHPFMQISKLAQDSGMTSEELRALCNKVQDAGSEDEKLKIIDDERKHREAQIRHFKARGKTQPSLAVRLSRQLPTILDNKPSELVDYNPTTRVGYLEKVEQASEILQQLVELQRNANESTE